MTTPSMRFGNVVLAAPVLPADFDWSRLGVGAKDGQVQNVRYDVAQWDWPVGILCPALRSLGFRDVGPSGLSGFSDEAKMIDSKRIQIVGWYDGGHGSSLLVDPIKHIYNLSHLLAFAESGKDLGAGQDLIRPLGGLRIISAFSPYLVWGALSLVLCTLIVFIYRGGRITIRSLEHNRDFRSIALRDSRRRLGPFLLAKTISE